MDTKLNEQEMNLQQYEKEYSESKLWEKIKNFAKSAGIKAIYMVLLLYYALQSPGVSSKERTLIMGALGYFILPFDLITDTIPVVGYTDDVAVLLALIKLLTCIDAEIKKLAKSKLDDWFGDFDEKELEGI